MREKAEKNTLKNGKNPENYIISPGFMANNIFVLRHLLPSICFNRVSISKYTVAQPGRGKWTIVHFIWRFTHRSFYQKVPVDRNFTSSNFFCKFSMRQQQSFCLRSESHMHSSCKIKFGNEKSIKMSQITVDARTIADLQETRSIVIQKVFFIDLYVKD